MIKMHAVIAPMLEASSTSEVSVNFYQTTWHNNPEDSHLQNAYGCGNLFVSY
jgi:hypothetical protein